MSSVSTTPPNRALRSSKFQRDLQQAYATGRYDCKLEVHFKTRRFASPTDPNRMYTDVERQQSSIIFDLMMPGQTAKCQCERIACQDQWPLNFHGMYTTQAIAPGSYTKGLDNGNSTPRKVCSLNYSMKRDDFKFLADRFPEWFFVTRFAGAHDHPIAHATAKLAAERLFDKLPRGSRSQPKVYVDLHGNPGACEAYMRRNPGIVLICVVECITPKDHVRRGVKWGPEFVGNQRRWVSCSIRDLGLGNVPFFLDFHVDGFVSHHTSYYYDNSEIARLLDRYRCNLYAAVHRFAERSGTRNNGEQKWETRVKGHQDIIYQTNVLTGETYDHPNNNHWFENDSFTWNAHGIAWTSNLLCDETFLITIVYCSAVQCRISTRCMDHVGVLTNDRLPQSDNLSAVTQEEIARTNRVEISICGVKSAMPIRSQLVGFFGDMRRAAVGRSRTPSKYEDHIARCQIACKGVMRTHNITLDAQELSEIALFSYFIDFEDQCTNNKETIGLSYAKAIANDRLFKEGQGYVLRSSVNVLADMLLAARDSKNLTQAVVRGAHAGVVGLRSKKVL